MRSAEYPYPPDEFDAAAGAGGPRGVHRAPRSAWSRWWPFLVALVVVPAIAVGAVFVLSGWGEWPWSADASTSSASTPADSGDEETPAESSTPDPSASAESPSASDPASSSAPAAQPDLTRAVLVENATGKSGLASGARDRLKAAGYTSLTTGNWKGATLTASTVYYPTEADAATAAAVAQQLGITTVTLDAAAAGDQVRVVLEADYQP